MGCSPYVFLIPEGFYSLTTVVCCCFLVSLFLVWSILFCSSFRVLLASVGTARGTPLICPGGRREGPSCGGDQSPVGSRLLLVAIPTAWVRLGAQPDGPIPRFLRLAIIPDPDGPSCSSGGTRVPDDEPAPCGTALYTGECSTSTVSRTARVMPSHFLRAVDPPQQTITTRAAVFAGRERLLSTPARPIF